MTQKKQVRVLACATLNDEVPDGATVGVCDGCETPIIFRDHEDMPHMTKLCMPCVMRSLAALGQPDGVFLLDKEGNATEAPDGGEKLFDLAKQFSQQRKGRDH